MTITLDWTDVLSAALGMLLGHVRCRVLRPGAGIGWFLSGGAPGGRLRGVAGVLPLTVAFAVAAAGSAGAQVHNPPPSHPAPSGPGSPTSHEEAHEEHFHPNELALIIAATYEEGAYGMEGRNYFTVGGEYERRLTRALGIGAEFEYLADADAWIFLAPVTCHPVGGLKLFGGLGFERKAVHKSEHGGRHEGVLEEGERENLLLWRVGGGYAFEFAERYSFGPTVSLDFVRESGAWVNALVYGVTFGVGF